MKDKKLVFGFGINDADYSVDIRKKVEEDINGKIKQKVIWSCPFYVKWKDMIKRCYSVEYQSNQPSYVGCFVDPHWRYFTVFRSWMEKQDWKDKALDKDLLVVGNKRYGPDTCIFLDRSVNNFISEKDERDLPKGCTFYPERNKYAAFGVLNGKSVNLGYFSEPTQAHQAWLNFKLEQAHILAAGQTDPRIAAALIDRYENYAKYFPQPT